MKDRYSTYKSSELFTFNEVPTHWNKNRIKYIGFMYGGLTGKSGDDFRKDEDDPTNKPFIPFTNICNNTYIKREDLKLVSINEYDTQNRVEKDDLFFMMTSETQEDVGKTSVLKEDLGEVYLNTFCKGYRITNKSVNPYFLNYLLNGKPYREILSIEGNGFTRINLRQDRVNDFIVFTPPLPEQEQIVKFLDEKTSQIDNLISLTEKKIELLKQKRTSLINEVVTKGLNPDVELKDSGVEWIGEIPKHWNRTTIKRLVTTKLTDGPHLTPNIVDEGVPFISVESIKDDKIDFDYKRGCITKEDDIEFSKKCKPQKEDILFVKSGSTTGKVTIVETDIDFNVWSPLCLIRPDINKVLPRFVFHSMKSDFFQLSVQQSWSFGTQPNIGMGVIENLYLIVPPTTEQEQIVEYIDTHTTEIDKLVSIEQRRIETLKEYRLILISEVVTGKIKITNKK